MTLPLIACLRFIIPRASQKSSNFSCVCFGEDISNLISCSNILQLKLLFKNLLSNEMVLKFNVLCSSMKYWIWCWLDCSLIVTPQSDGILPFLVNVSNQLFQLNSSCSHCCNVVLCFGARQSNIGLLLAALQNCSWSHIKIVACCWSSIFHISCPIRIHKAI